MKAQTLERTEATPTAKRAANAWCVKVDTPGSDTFIPTPRGVVPAFAPGPKVLEAGAV